MGDDPFADSAEQLYADEGVSTDHIHRTPGTNTGVGMVTLLPSGENSIVGHLGANMLMQPLHVEAFEPAVARSDVLMAQLEVPVEAVSRALELGRKHRVLTILNPAPGQTLEPDTLANVDLLTPNESETRILLGLPPDDPTPTQDLAGRLLALGVETIIVTRGEKGALIVTPRGTEAVPATPVQALDVTGAGDSFNAALAVGLAEGLDLRAAVEQANRAGAYTTTHLGVIDGLPTRSELEAFRGNAV